MNRWMKKVVLAAPLLVSAAVLAGMPALAQNTQSTIGGNTTVALSSTFLSALTTLKVTPGTIAPTQLVGTTVNFPVTGGAIDEKTAAGQIVHSGGLTLTAGKTVVNLQNFIVDTTGSSPIISGLVVANGKLVGRITLFDLTLPADLQVPLYESAGVIAISDVTVKLDAGAAQALNSAFGVSAFTGGLDVGTAYVLTVNTPEAL
jgi:hypothetical protein